MIKIVITSMKSLNINTNVSKAYDFEGFIQKKSQASELFDFKVGFTVVFVRDRLVSIWQYCNAKRNVNTLWPCFLRRQSGVWEIPGSNSIL